MPPNISDIKYRKMIENHAKEKSFDRLLFFKAKTQHIVVKNRLFACIRDGEMIQYILMMKIKSSK